MFNELLRYQKNKREVYIDLETFNLCLSFVNNRPWQVGVLVVENGEIVRSHDIHVKWDTDLKIGREAAFITHYNQDKFDRLAIPSEEAFEIVKKELDIADYIIGHNTLGFDVYLLMEWWKLNKLDFRHYLDKFIDTHCLAKGIKLGLPFKAPDTLLQYQYRLLHKVQKGLKTRIPILAKEYEIEFDENELHSAVYDLTINKKIWDKMKWGVEA